MKRFLSIIKYLFLAFFGGLIYILLELSWRGYSHWTMFILGGLCFLSVGLLNEFFSWDLEFEKQILIGGTLITILEFITGVIVNLILKWNIWDYSMLPLNILGQISLPFTLLWIVLSAAIILVDDWIRYKIFNEEKPRYKFYLSKFFNRDKR